ncbi:MAG: 4Fe-4S dicluster domain-containing protein [Desulfobulbaceae bacterium]|nr:4Fe-4S dicluster domain-containing protein [Desulfobulbaceae bacterium]
MDRRNFIKGAASTLAALALAGCNEQVEEYLQQHFVEMSKEELDEARERLKKKYRQKFGVDFKIGAEPALPEVLFSYGLDLSRCIGCRRCVYACVQENNQSRKPQIQWIRVVRMENGSMDLEESDHYYEGGMVPKEGYYTMPIQCQQCENPPCVKVCPTKATWQEPDGIVVVDYNWCIGCRYCMAACPYWARRFNFSEPHIPKEEINPNTHYLGNRPRMRGVVEKCTFCIQRTRKGRYPACVEACPVGARKFGNILDPDSEISKVIETKRVFRLKSELNTQPKFYYFFSI